MFPLQLCQFCVSSVVRHGIQILQIEDRTILVNNTPHTIHCRPLLASHPLGTDDQVTASSLSLCTHLQGFSVRFQTHTKANVQMSKPRPCTKVKYAMEYGNGKYAGSECAVLHLYLNSSNCLWLQRARTYEVLVFETSHLPSLYSPHKRYRLLQLSKTKEMSVNLA